jgi:cephalosporin hydroxylase
MTNPYRVSRVVCCAVVLAAFACAERASAEATPTPAAPAGAQDGSPTSAPKQKPTPHAPPPPTCSVPEDQVSDCFADRLAKEVLHNTWFGVPTLQNPLDVWITQEIISQTKPDFIIETGTFVGGSAALWATILEQVNPKGRVITIDIHDASRKTRETLPIFKKRIDFILGSSTSDETFAKVKKIVGKGSVMVILDSGHTEHHVLDELRLYAPLVHVGGYIVVQDGFFDGKQPTGFGPGPKAAAQAFVAENDSFVADRDRERLKGSFNPYGFLRRVK